MSALGKRAYRTVVVTLDTGESFKGLLAYNHRDAVVLQSAGLVDPQSDSKFIPADGELVLPKGRIAYYQFP